MRNLLWQGGLCCIAVIGIACKALIRPLHGEVHAISDATLTLGLVPIHRDDDMRAYRLLVCKRVAVYSPQLLADDDHCRVALRDGDRAEVVFWPNDFRRDFASKYEGYVKHAAIAALAVVPLALVGRLAGRWKIMRLAKREDTGLELKDFAEGKFTRKLIDDGMGSSGMLFYRAAWRMRTTEIFARIAHSTGSEAIRAEVEAFGALTKVFENAVELKTLGDSKRILEEIRTMPTDKVEARLGKLEKEIIEHNGSMGFGEEGTFTESFFAHKKRYRELIAAVTAEGKSLAEMKVLARELHEAAQAYGEGLPRYEELYAKSTVLMGKDASEYYRLVKQVNSEFVSKQAELLANEDDALRLSVELLQTTAEARRNASMYALGGGGLGAAILSAIDKSIWGYAERQLSRYWHQIFVVDDDFAAAHPVHDIGVILRALADEFGFVVNPRALQLSPPSL